MNKVFKVIWSEARNAYVVVSEIAKNHGSKSCSTKKLLTMLIATGVMTCASMAPAMAASANWQLSTDNGTTTKIEKNATVNFSGEKDSSEHQNIKVTNEGTNVTFELNSKLENITSVGIGKSRVTLAPEFAGITNGTALMTIMNNSINVGTITGGTVQIHGVAAGTAENDAVNYGQLQATNTKVENLTVEAGKHTTLVAGDNVQVKEEKTDNGLKYTVSATDTTYTAGNGIAINGENNAISVNLKEGEVNLAVDEKGLSLNKDLQGIESISNNTSKLVLREGWAGMQNGVGASVFMVGGLTTINGKVTVDEQGKISGVAAGNADTDAVNYGQLKDVKTEAGKHTTLSDGKNTTVESTVKDGQTDYKVNVAGDLTDITSVANGGAKLALDGAAGTAGIVNGKGASIFMMNDSTVINNVVGIDKNGKITGVAAGTADTDAVNVSQLKKVSDTANAGWTLSTNGNATAGTKVTPGAFVDFSGDQNVSVSNKGTAVSVKLNNALKDIESISNGDAKLALNGAAGTAGIINGQGASVYMQGSTTVINSKVSVDKDGKISGVAAGKISADSTDAVNGSQLNAVATEAGKHSKVVNGNNTNVEETTVDGQKVYKVNLNNNVMVGDVNGKYVSISGTNGTVEATGAIATKDRVYADKGGKLADIDVTGNTISNGDAKLALNGAAGTAGIINGQGASVYMQGSTTVINSKVSVDKDGKISGVAAGTADTDAVNVSQLKKVSDTANAGWNLSTNGAATEATNVKPGDNVDFSGDKNISVSNDGTAVSVKLNKNLKNIETISNGGATLTLGAMGGMVSEFTNGQGASVKLFGDTTTINGKVNVYKDGRIAGVADGVNATDAVNVSQLKKVSDTANAGWNLSTNGAATEATNVKPGDNVDFSGDKNISVSNDGTKVKVELNKNLKDIESISNGGASLTLGAMGGMVSEFANGQGASVKLFGDTTIINGKVNVYKDGRIAGVADGVNANDAVNVSQLQKAAAATETTVSDGVNTTVTATKAKDGHTDYKVNLNKNLKDIESISNGGASLTLGAMGGMVSEFANGQGASVKLFGDTTIINGKVNVYKDGRIAGVADGVNANDAVNVSQLQKAAAATETTVSDGVNTTVTATKAEDGHTDYKVNLNKDLVGIESISNAGASLTMNGIATELANGQGASVKLFGDTTTINNAVTVYKDGRISGVADGINNNDAVNVGQLNKVSEIANKGWNLATNGVATEATNVKPGDYVDFSGDKNISVSHDGTKVKVELNKDLNVNSVQTNALNSKYNLSVGTMAENGIMPFFVNSTGAFYAASNKFSVDKDGNMNANSVQTNALNSKYNLSVGTANENGIVPFFVNSNGAFYAANNNFSVDKDGKVIATAGEIGNVVLNNGVYTGHSALRDGELFVGDASGNYSQITTKGAKLGKVTIAEDGKISGVAAGEVSSTSTDAINGSQLHQTNENVAALDKRVTQNEADIATNKANIAQNAADIAANKANIAQNAADIATNKANIAQNAADIAQNKADIAQNKADIAQNKADIAQNKTDIKNLDNRVTNVEELAKKHTTVTAGDNVTVTEDTNKDGGKEYKVALAKEIKLDKVTTGQTVMNNDGLKVGDKVSVTATAVTAGKTSISDEGVKVGDKTYISDKGLNANDQKVTNVAAGEISATSKDAVNGSQLYATNQEVANNTNRINQLGSRVNKVGAGAAALAALHPMDFDPDDKLTFSAGYGNYGGENAAAIGAYYRPDEKVMFSVGGTVGNGENMVNAGVSFSLDRTNHVSNSRTAMAREILDLRAEVTELKAMVAKGGLGSIAEDKMKIFPDVAENHWAYEYVGKLAAAGIIEGYPDGKFSGDRMMSRYEFAAMLYRAMQKGAQLDSKIINEFAPEMGRIRVDRISGEDGDRDKIERVRVNAVKGERDHYGNKIAKAEAKAK
ncbi:ESPR-type extended signal peptide-containing protein [Phascolarctobacterium succinatutens]|uniref:ESPR-type extended signal peptide-containing protein n=1 Tax=Phascolarctobacterium succinatutens TaxID=626940 RepID=UPI00307F1D87